MKKSLAWLTSALKTRTTVRLRLCASEKPERTWFLNNAIGRQTSIIMNEINCIKKSVADTCDKNFLDFGIVALNFAGVGRGSREKTFSDSILFCLLLVKLLISRGGGGG